MSTATTTFTTRLQAAHDQLTQQRTDLNQAVSESCQRINADATEIASLNFQIKQVELNGDMANDLRDRRDLILDELSSIGDISYSEQPIPASLSTLAPTNSSSVPPPAK